jgi:signal transduction histidine kinase
MFNGARRGPPGRPRSPAFAARNSLGLGLFILRAIVQAHGGSLGVTSEADAGTTFTVTLPRRVAPD